MNDVPLRRQLARIHGDDPTPEFVDRLRSRLSEGESFLRDASVGDDEVTLINVGPPTELARRPRSLRPLQAAAAVFLGILVLLGLARNGRNLETTTATEAHRVGEAWLGSITEGNRDEFMALHAGGVEVDDTLMGFSEDVGLLTPARISELYYDGFDALQAALDADGDVVSSDGCIDTGEGEVTCGFTATMIGTDEYTYSVAADLVIEDRLITSIDFSATTDPADFRSVVQNFMDEQATDEDRACLAVGFNTVGCGEHESDFIKRYATYYEANQDSPGG